MAEFGYFFQTEWHLKRRQAQAPSWVWVHDFFPEACGQITVFDFGHLMIPNGGMAIRHDAPRQRSDFRTQDEIISRCHLLTSIFCTVRCLNECHVVFL